MNEIALESYAVMKRVIQGKTILLPYFIMIVLYGLWKDTRYVSGPKKGHFFQERKDRKTKTLFIITDRLSCIVRYKAIVSPFIIIFFPMKRQEKKRFMFK